MPLQKIAQFSLEATVWKLCESSEASRRDMRGIFLTFRLFLEVSGELFSFLSFFQEVLLTQIAALFQGCVIDTQPRAFRLFELLVHSNLNHKVPCKWYCSYI